jgi:hypothetical protein
MIWIPAREEANCAEEAGRRVKEWGCWERQPCGDKLGPARAELASEARSVTHEIGEIR